MGKNKQPMRYFHFCGSYAENYMNPLGNHIAHLHHQDYNHQNWQDCGLPCICIMQEIVIKSLRWSKVRQVFNQNFQSEFSIRIFNQFLYVVELMMYRATSNLDLLQFMRQKMIILRSRLGVEEFLTTEIIMNDN